MSSETMPLLCNAELRGRCAQSVSHEESDQAKLSSMLNNKPTDSRPHKSDLRPRVYLNFKHLLMHCLSQPLACFIAVLWCICTRLEGKAFPFFFWEILHKLY